MAASVGEIAQGLAVACLSNTAFISNLIPTNAKKGEAELAGKKIGEFYRAIHNAVQEAHSVNPLREED